MKRMQPVMSVLLLLVMIMTGCATTESPKISMDKLPEDLDAVPSEIGFLDINAFDHNFATTLRENYDTVTVTFESPISTNNIPDRMATWLDKLAERGGKIAVEPEPVLAMQDGEKSIVVAAVITGVTLSYKLYQWHREKQMYNSITPYDATIYYEPNTGAVSRIGFTRH